MELLPRTADAKMLGMEQAHDAQALLEKELKEQSASSSSPSRADVADAADPTDNKAALLGNRVCGPGSLFNMMAFAAAGGAVKAGMDPYEDGSKEFCKCVTADSPLAVPTNGTLLPVLDSVVALMLHVLLGDAAPRCCPHQRSVTPPHAQSAPHLPHCQPAASTSCMLLMHR